MIALVLAALIVAQAPQEPDRSAHTAVAVPESESRQHLIGTRPILRVSADRARHIPFSRIRVQTTVDATGAVTAASALNQPDGDAPVSSETRAEAEIFVRALRYTPFERGGHAVSATFQQYVLLLPPEIVPFRHVPFPKVKNLKSVKITLQRTGCHGPCPAYSVEVHGDGTVVCDGESSVTFTGHHRGSVSQDDVRALIQVFKDADYFSLDDKYEMGAANGATHTTSIEIGRSRKQVTDHFGIWVGMPLAVMHLEEEVDRLSGSERWTLGNADTLPALKAEHWDFKSSEAAATLVRVASRGNADAVHDLVNAGVPVVAKQKSESPLFTAAHRGDPVMLKALLDAGAGDDAYILDMSLRAAAGSGNVEAFRLLLQRGAHIDAPDDPDIGYTILMLAAGSGVPAMVREVLRYQPDVNAATQASQAMKASGNLDFDGLTALMEAILQYARDVDPEGVDRPEVVRLLLEAGADPNARDRHGNTALMLCSQRSDIALLLIKAGADVNARNDKGETPLGNTSDESVKRVLLEHGATHQDYRN